MTVKGLAIISGSYNPAEPNFKHEIKDTGDVVLGTTDAAGSSILGGTVFIKGLAAGTHLAGVLNTLSGSVGTRIQQSFIDRNAIRGELDSVADALGATTTAAEDGTNRYSYDADASEVSTIHPATSFAEADGLIAEALNALSSSIATLVGDQDTVGSIENSLRKWLLGGASGVAVQTMSEISSSMAGDPQLSSSIMQRLQQLKDTVRGTNNSFDSLKSLQEALESHETNTVVPAKALLDNRLGELSNIVGTTQNAQGEYDFSVELSASTQDVDLPGSVTATTVLDADEKLDAAHAETRRRLKLMVESGISTGNLTVAGDTTIEGSLSFDAGSDMQVPTYDNQLPAHMLDGNGDLLADQTPFNGETFYLKGVTGLPAPFTIANKFYFCEDGVWFASPFFSETGEEVSAVTTATISVNNSIPDAFVASVDGVTLTLPSNVEIYDQATFAPYTGDLILTTQTSAEFGANPTDNNGGGLSSVVTISAPSAVGALSLIDLSGGAPIFLAATITIAMNSTPGSADDIGVLHLASGATDWVVLGGETLGDAGILSQPSAGTISFEVSSFSSFILGDMMVVDMDGNGTPYLLEVPGETLQFMSIDTWGDGWNASSGFTIIEPVSGETTAPIVNSAFDYDPYSAVPNSVIHNVELGTNASVAFLSGSSLLYNLDPGSFPSEVLLKGVYQKSDGTFVDVFTGQAVASLESATPIAAMSAPTGDIISPFIPDADGDGVVDSLDAFPNDPYESTDVNENLVGDNADVVDIVALLNNSRTKDIWIRMEPNDPDSPPGEMIAVGDPASIVNGMMQPRAILGQPFVFGEELDPAIGEYVYQTSVACHVAGGQELPVIVEGIVAASLIEVYDIDPITEGAVPLVSIDAESYNPSSNPTTNYKLVIKGDGITEELGFTVDLSVDDNPSVRYLPIDLSIDHDSDGFTLTDLFPFNRRKAYDDTRRFLIKPYGTTGNTTSWHLTSENPGGFVQLAYNSLTNADALDTGGYLYYPALSGSQLRASSPTDNNPDWADNDADGFKEAGNNSGTGGWNYLYINLPTNGTVHRLTMRDNNWVDLYHGAQPDGSYTYVSTTNTWMLEDFNMDPYDPAGGSNGFALEMRLSGTGANQVFETRVAAMDENYSLQQFSDWKSADSDADLVSDLDEVNADPYATHPHIPEAAWNQADVGTLTMSLANGTLVATLNPVGYLYTNTTSGNPYYDAKTGTSYQILNNPGGLFSISNGNELHFSGGLSDVGQYTPVVLASNSNVLDQTNGNPAPFITPITVDVVGVSITDLNENAVDDATDVADIYANLSNTTTVTLEQYHYYGYNFTSFEAIGHIEPVAALGTFALENIAAALYTSSGSYQQGGAWAEPTGIPHTVDRTLSLEDEKPIIITLTGYYAPYLGYGPSNYVTVAGVDTLLPFSTSDYTDANGDPMRRFKLQKESDGKIRIYQDDSPAGNGAIWTVINVFDAPSAAPDTDGDGFADDVDAFINDPYEWLDTDSDGTGDNADAFPNDPAEQVASSEYVQPDLGVGENMMTAYLSVDATASLMSTELNTATQAVNNADATALANSQTAANGFKQSLESDKTYALGLMSPSSNVMQQSKYSTLDSKVTVALQQWVQINNLFIAADTDGDGYDDSIDAFINDPYEWLDTDSDGTGDNADAFINDPAEQVESQEVGVGVNMYTAWANLVGQTGSMDAAFQDAGTAWMQGLTASLATAKQNANASKVIVDTNYSNALALQNSGSSQNQIDKLADCTILRNSMLNTWNVVVNVFNLVDTDGDGRFDNLDAFPNDPYEWADADNDGYGDNLADAFPNDAAEYQRAHTDPNTPYTMGGLSTYNAGKSMFGYYDSTVYAANYIADAFTVSASAAYNAGDAVTLGTIKSASGAHLTNISASQLSAKTLMDVGFPGWDSGTTYSGSHYDVQVAGYNAIVDTYPSASMQNGVIQGFSLTDADSDSIFAEPIAAQNNVGDPDDSVANTAPTLVVNDIAINNLSVPAFDAPSLPGHSGSDGNLTTRAHTWGFPEQTFEINESAFQVLDQHGAVDESQEATVYYTWYQGYPLYQYVDLDGNELGNALSSAIWTTSSAVPIYGTHNNFFANDPWPHGNLELKAKAVDRWGAESNILDSMKVAAWHCGDGTYQDEGFLLTWRANHSPVFNPNDWYLKLYDIYSHDSDNDGVFDFDIPQANISADPYADDSALPEALDLYHFKLQGMTDSDGTGSANSTGWSSPASEARMVALYGEDMTYNPNNDNVVFEGNTEGVTIDYVIYGGEQWPSVSNPYTSSGPMSPTASWAFSAPPAWSTPLTTGTNLNNYYLSALATNKYGQISGYLSGDGFQLSGSNTNWMSSRMYIADDEDTKRFLVDADIVATGSYDSFDSEGRRTAGGWPMISDRSNWAVLGSAFGAPIPRPLELHFPEASSSVLTSNPGGNPISTATTLVCVVGDVIKLSAEGADNNRYINTSDGTITNVVEAHFGIQRNHEAAGEFTSNSVTDIFSTGITVLGQPVTTWPLIIGGPVIDMNCGLKTDSGNWITNGLTTNGPGPKIWVLENEQYYDNARANFAASGSIFGALPIQDLDGDGMPDNVDPHPLISDMDHDGVNDVDDAFPNDPYEWEDTDADGTGDNSDPDPLNPFVPSEDLPVLLSLSRFNRDYASQMTIIEDSDVKYGDTVGGPGANNTGTPIDYSLGAYTTGSMQTLEQGSDAWPAKAAQPSWFAYNTEVSHLMTLASGSAPINVEYGKSTGYTDFAAKLVFAGTEIDLPLNMQAVPLGPTHNWVEGNNDTGYYQGAQGSRQNPALQENTSTHEMDSVALSLVKISNDTFELHVSAAFPSFSTVATFDTRPQRAVGYFDMTTEGTPNADGDTFILNALGGQHTITQGQTNSATTFSGSSDDVIATANLVAAITSGSATHGISALTEPGKPTDIKLLAPAGSAGNAYTATSNLSGAPGTATFTGGTDGNAWNGSGEFDV